MKILRIELKQSQASYTREETVDNHTTYPLPPFSTVIGALHNACNYTEYHPMDISVQGRYGSMKREYYVNHGLLNNREEDRNVLVYLKNPDLLSAGFIQIGEGLKGKGNSFYKRITVRIDNEEYYKKYVNIMDRKNELEIEKNEEMKPNVVELKQKEKELKAKQKGLDKKSEEYSKLQVQITKTKEEYKNIEDSFKEKYQREYEDKQKHYRTLVKKPSLQEVLYDVELVIHVKTDDNTANDILENINNFVCLGRSEDFIELIDIKETEILTPEDDVFLKDNFKIYAPLSEITTEDEEKVYTISDGDNVLDAKGTVYYLNKDYKIVDMKREFNRIPCLYSSSISIDEESGGIVDDKGYIVCFN